MSFVAAEAPPPLQQQPVPGRKPWARRLRRIPGGGRHGKDKGERGEPQIGDFFLGSAAGDGVRGVLFFFFRAPCLAQPHPSLRVASSPGAAGMRALGAVPGCGGEP